MNRSKKIRNHYKKKEFDLINTKKFVILIFIILLFSPISGCLQQEPSVDNNHNIIQKAIDAAENDTSIIIESGVYNELIVLNKPIKLIGKEKNTTIINFYPDHEITGQIAIISINANNCSLENLQITFGNKSDSAIGISINSKYNTIKNTIITNVTNAIELSSHSESNTITHNQIQNNYIGIESLGSTHNIIFHNTFTNNTKYNIHLSTRSDHNNVSFNTIEKSNNAIRIKGSIYNNVSTNCITNNQIGLFCCCGANSNYFYNNIFINNSEINAIEGAGPNTWYNVLYGLGNYWDDYNGTDANHDGIGDTPYEISDIQNLDMYPLLNIPIDAPCKQ